MDTNLSNSDRPLRLADAQSAIDLFDFELARNILRDIIRREPSAEAYYLAANVALDNNQRILLLQRALELDPSHVKALTGLHGAVDANVSSKSTLVTKLPEKTEQIEDLSDNNKNITPATQTAESITDDNIITPVHTTYTSSERPFSDNQSVGFQIGGYRIASPGAVVALICFFLPWYLYSCDSPSPTPDTGLSMLTNGSKYFFRGNFTSFSEFFGNLLLFLLIATLLLAPILVLSLFGSMWRYKTRLNRYDGNGLIALGILPLLSIFTLIKLAVSFKQFIPFLLGIDLDSSRGVFQIQYGLQGAILGYIAIIIGGILNRRILQLQKQPRLKSSNFDLVTDDRRKSQN